MCRGRRPSAHEKAPEGVSLQGLWFGKVLCAELLPDLFHLLCRLAVDKRVPVAEKAKVPGYLPDIVRHIPLDRLQRW